MAKKITIKAEGNTATIKVLGRIYPWNNDSETFDMKLEALREQGVQDLKVYINSEGGDVDQAYEIYNLLQAWEGTVTVECGALCLSAATYIAMAASPGKLGMAKNGLWMVHKPWLGFEGNEDEVERQVTILRAIQNEMVSRYAARTGIEEDEMLKMLAEETWLSAEEAKEKGFIDYIIGQEEEMPADSIMNLKRLNFKHIPKSLKLKTKKPVQAAPKNEQQTQFSTEMDINKLRIVAGAGDGETEDQVVARIKAFKEKAENADKLQKELNDLKESAVKDKAESLADTAIAGKRILASQKDMVVKMATADYDTAKAFVDSLKPAAKLTDDLKPKATGEGAESGEGEAEYKDWSDVASQHNYAQIRAMKTEAPEKFKAIKACYKKHFGTDMPE